MYIFIFVILYSYNKIAFRKKFQLIFNLIKIVSLLILTI